MNYSSSEKLEIINRYLKKLICISEKSIKNHKYNKALDALSAYCRIQYEINQVYKDDRAEELLMNISDDIVKVSKKYCGKSNTVLFYDGFGLDLRGWAASYVRAIVGNGYNLIYVTNKKKKDSIPHILEELHKGGNSTAVFIDMSKGNVNWINELNNVFEEYKPQFAFFYTTPYDVSATAVFDSYRGKVIRTQIDLTDHAFWIGLNAADYFTECRVPGASNAIYERGLSKEKIIKIDCCLYINRDIDDEPLPFDIDKERYFFSGGALYKTLGDDELLFYRVIDEILNDNPNVKYLYAGKGDDSELKLLVGKYPKRVFHIEERTDFYRLIENCEFMWNTYPMFGGLMMRFAANAKKIPLTLKHGKDHEGLLNNQAQLGIEFESYKDVIEEANNILKDKNYKTLKEEKLENAVISEEVFLNNIQLIIDEQKSEFDFTEIPYINTDEFRKTYLERVNNPEMLAASCIVNRNCKSIIPMFPYLFFKRLLSRVKKGD